MIRIRTVNRWYRERFGRRVQRIPFYAGGTCPHRGHSEPHTGCIYCDARASAAASLDLECSPAAQVMATIERYGRRGSHSAWLLYHQPFTATAQPPGEFLAVIEPLLDDRDVVGISLGTRPDTISPAWRGLLSDLARRTYVEVELGLQSANDATLNRIRRGHDRASFDAAVSALHDADIPVVAHVILGLPGESTVEMEARARHLADSGVHGVKIHALHVMRSSPLAAFYGVAEGMTLEGGEILDAEGLPDLEILTRERYADLLAQFLHALGPHIVLYRYTGEAFSNDLAGPAWVREKRKLVTWLDRRLHESGIELLRGIPL